MQDIWYATPPPPVKQSEGLGPTGWEPLNPTVCSVFSEGLILGRLSNIFLSFILRLETDDLRRKFEKEVEHALWWRPSTYQVPCGNLCHGRGAIWHPVSLKTQLHVLCHCSHPEVCSIASLWTQETCCDRLDRWKSAEVVECGLRDGCMTSIEFSRSSLFRTLQLLYGLCTLRSPTRERLVEGWGGCCSPGCRSLPALLQDTWRNAPTSGLAWW